MADPLDLNAFGHNFIRIGYFKVEYTRVRKTERIIQ